MRYLVGIGLLLPTLLLGSLLLANPDEQSGKETKKEIDETTCLKLAKPSPDPAPVDTQALVAAVKKLTTTAGVAAPGELRNPNERIAVTVSGSDISV